MNLNFDVFSIFAIVALVVLGIVFAVGKEVYDYFAYGKHTKGFWKMTLGDLIADAVGIIVAVFLVA